MGNLAHVCYLIDQPPMDKSTMHVSVLDFSIELQIHVFQQTMSCLHLDSQEHLKCNLPKTDHIISLWKLLLSWHSIL